MPIYFAYNSPDGSPYDYEFFDTEEKAKLWCENKNKEEGEGKSCGWYYQYEEIIPK